MSHRITLLLVTAIITVFSLQLGARPVDERAARELAHCADVLAKPIADRQLTKDQEESLMALAKADGVDVRMVAAYLFAFSNSQRTMNVLKALSDDSSPLVSGCAIFSLQWRSLLNKGNYPSAADLEKVIKESTNSYTRIMLINRLAVDYRKDAFPLIFDLLLDEKDEVVRSEILYYIVIYGDLRVCQEAAKLQWDETRIPGESLSFLLGMITPDRSRAREDNSTGELLKKLKQRIKE